MTAPAPAVCGEGAGGLDGGAAGAEVVAAGLAVGAGAPNGANGLRLPAGCGEIFLPQSDKLSNAGSEKREVSSVMVLRSAKAVSKSSPSAAEAGAAGATDRYGETGPAGAPDSELSAAKMRSASATRTNPPISIITRVLCKMEGINLFFGFLGA